MEPADIIKLTCLCRIGIAVEVITHGHSCGLVWELDEGLVPVGSDIELGLHQTSEGSCQLTQLLVRRLIRQVSDVQDL